MAAQLKTFFSPDLVRDLGASLRRVYPAFPEARFVREATKGLASMELLDRARHLGRTMGDCLPPDYKEAIGIVLASLGPEHATEELEGVGMAPFFYMPHLVFVAERGLEDRHFDLSMKAQYELTKRFTAEFSIRAFLAKDPEKTFAVLERWAADPNPHVRRLVSEGTRPRLPWAPRVRVLDEDPARALLLLEELKDDPASLVRRSVANHLNDVGKSHPELLISTCRRWLEGATAERRALVEHALRSAVKRGLPGALDLLGHGAAPRVRVVGAGAEPARVVIGREVRLSWTIESRSRSSQALLVDLAVHFVKASGKASAKVFKVARIDLRAGESVRLEKTISLAVHTTRKPYPGAHVFEVIVNGTRLQGGAFEVAPARRS